ncbi:MAG TPA: 3-phosphoshikimate 1-carboxyvinyltransferase [Alphaproteobacteria bacterium]|nr:3-phosphoshikimate 1-carboxyvinyltransferase [Alphaproteobacteria bacterium]
MSQNPLHPLISRPSGPLKGVVTPPGDKSISHRAVILGGIAEGETVIKGLLEGEDVLRTVAALRALGATARKDSDGIWRIKGTGLEGLHAPADMLDMGNSGTAARLLIGLLAGKSFASRFTGDASLQKRPMKRVIEPLMQMGASFESNEGRLPLTVTGAAKPTAITYELPVASAQVKSAILLAGLSAEGVTTVIERAPTRDHSERMLRAFGAHIEVKKTAEGEAISLTGKPRLKGQNITVPADPSSAAFPLVAALLHPGSRVTLKNTGINPRRAGLIETLKEMGGKIALENRREESGEPVADLVVEGGKLKGITVPAERAPSMIDEYPILAVAAACAEGTTRMQGLGELRVKESDRLELMRAGLALCGARAEIEGDDLIVHGTSQSPPGMTNGIGATVLTAMDHRIAMSFLILGSAAQEPVRIDDGSFIATSFPGFVAMMNGLGMKIG